MVNAADVAALVLAALAVILTGAGLWVMFRPEREDHPGRGVLVLDALPAEWDGTSLASLADHDLRLGGAQTELFGTEYWPPRRPDELGEKLAETSEIAIVRALIAGEDFAAGLDRWAELAMEHAYALLTSADIGIDLASVGTGLA